MAIGDYLSTTDVARTLRLSVERVRQFYGQGRLAGVKVGQTIFFHRDDVAAFKRLPRKPGRPAAKK